LSEKARSGESSERDVIVEAERIAALFRPTPGDGKEEGWRLRTDENGARYFVFEKRPEETSSRMDTVPPVAPSPTRGLLFGLFRLR
jgi:hypothetical protein